MLSTDGRKGWAALSESPYVAIAPMRSIRPISSWHAYRVRRRWVIGLFIGYLPGMFALGTLLSPMFESDVPMVLIALAWMLAWAVAICRFSSFACPRCRKPFFGWGLGERTHTFARKCVHCGLPKWAE
jgi:hypothetical protein